MDVFLDPEYTLTGGGAWINYEEPGNLLTQCYPIQNRDGKWLGWTANAKDVWASSKASITVYAIGIKVIKDGKVVPIEQTVFISTTPKVELPATPDHDGWVAVGGGVKCEQNVFENVLISESTPFRGVPDPAESFHKITTWFGAKQFCFSPTSNRGPTGGGTIATYLIAIRAPGILFQTRVFCEKSELTSRPEAEVIAQGGVVVSGGAVDKQTDLSYTDFADQSVNMLTATYPLFDDDSTEKIHGWKAAGKDHHFTSHSNLRVYCVTLHAEEK
ncbi:MAG: hypothetical protein V4727_02840 [Verrucomicrobiota bacterium]